MPMNPKKIKEIVHTAMAAEYLGYKLIYLEAGSGAKTEIPIRIVTEVKKKVTLPVIVGGGIDSKNKVKRAIQSGANMIVIGNALEKNVYLLAEISSCFSKTISNVSK